MLGGASRERLYQSQGRLLSKGVGLNGPILKGVLSGQNPSGMPEEGRGELYGGV